MTALYVIGFFSAFILCEWMNIAAIESGTIPGAIAAPFLALASCVFFVLAGLIAIQGFLT